MNETMRFDGDEVPRQGHRTRLDRIARAVGCEVADFHRAAADRTGVGDAAELLACWTRIETAHARGVLLDLARHLSAGIDRDAACRTRL